MNRSPRHSQAGQPGCSFLPARASLSSIGEGPQVVRQLLDAKDDQATVQGHVGLATQVRIAIEGQSAAVLEA